ncbi:MAG: UDP-N-acetylglucosamine 2-epimerase (non-hydrolyzing) [Bacteroidetes bacterium]|nr:UDP-N-acetylglucosamine 2-epimerase (non-hydrolyzing) [Bacteroidota bacterium]MBL6944546.1 UDP-N-acetylglucosamine 2-epimerase (non-hydrolyzing) [Bacteroidales bacterium]
MIKIITVIGARPQIIKAAAISRAINKHFSDKINEIIVHTGQHYDNNMSRVFIEELGIPEPDYKLNVGSAGHAQQTAQMIVGIEGILKETAPDYLVLYGDTNSTLAGAIAASKIHIPIVHIEAGLRSFNKTMPEEINRIMCDHASTLLFTPTATGLKNLINEGFNPHNKFPFSADNPGVFHCGDIMYDNSLHFKPISLKSSKVIDDYKLEKDNFILCTIHRDNNTDNPVRLNAIFHSLNKIANAENITIIIPLHPRTSKLLNTNLNSELLSTIVSNPLIKLLPPVSFLDMISLESNCKLVMTDSGGVQKEAYFFYKPCIILRSETEWVEIVEEGAAIIANADEDKIQDAYNKLKNLNMRTFPLLFGDGKAAEFICKTMLHL